MIMIIMIMIITIIVIILLLLLLIMIIIIIIIMIIKIIMITTIIIMMMKITTITIIYHFDITERMLSVRTKTVATSSPPSSSGARIPTFSMVSPWSCSRKRLWSTQRDFSPNSASSAPSVSGTVASVCGRERRENAPISARR